MVAEEEADGDGRRRPVEDRCETTWLVLRRAAESAVDRACRLRRVPTDERDDLVSDALARAVERPGAGLPAETPLAVWMERVVERLARASRRRRARLWRQLDDARLASLAVDRVADDEEPAREVDLSSLTAAEKAAAQAVVDADGNVSAASRVLGVSRGALRSRLTLGKMAQDPASLSLASDLQEGQRCLQAEIPDITTTLIEMGTPRAKVRFRRSRSIHILQ